MVMAIKWWSKMEEWSGVVEWWRVVMVMVIIIIKMHMHLYVPHNPPLPLFLSVMSYINKGKNDGAQLMTGGNRVGDKVISSP